MKMLGLLLLLVAPLHAAEPPKTWAFNRGPQTLTLSTYDDSKRTLMMQLEPSGRLTIIRDGKTITTVEADGSVILKGNANDAARTFWEAIARMRPGCKQDAVK